MPTAGPLRRTDRVGRPGLDVVTPFHLVRISPLSLAVDSMQVGLPVVSTAELMCYPAG